MISVRACKTFFIFLKEAMDYKIKSKADTSGGYSALYSEFFKEIAVL